MSEVLDLKPGQKLPIDQKIGYLLEIAEEMLQRDVTRSQIAQKYGVTYMTAVSWFNEATMLIVKQDNGLTREGLRQIHKAQIERRIRELQNDLVIADNLKDRLAIHDRLVKYFDSLARIQGLNSEQINVSHELKPLQIVRNTEVVDSTVTSSKIV